MIDIAALASRARRDSRLNDFDDPQLLQRASDWLEVVAHEGRLSNAGHRVIESLVVNWLVNRLRMANDLRLHPQILEIPIRKPIFITGMPRTGTTKLQRALASAPGIQGLPFWRILNIAPIGPLPDSDTPDPRIAIADGYLKLILETYPEFLTAHPAFADEPEEESFLIESDFQSLANCTRIRAPSHWRRIAEEPNRESYPFLKRALQYTQWQAATQAPIQWVLKSPLHTGRIEALLETFPDATIVHTYRDPRTALPSTCRIVEVFRRIASDDVDLHEIGREQLEVWSAQLNAHLAQRVRIGPERIIDVHYNDVVRDVVATVKRIYQHHGLNFNEPAGAEMLEWEDRHPQHQFGRHRYSLENYGLTTERVEEAFRPYMQRFAHAVP